MPKLGVNIDHVATLRQARRVDYPDPVEAARAAERAGADAITVHLREDRRHIQDYDLFSLRSAIKTRINQELAPVDDIVELAVRLRPHEVCFVPERREEITTEGGLDVAGLHDRLERFVRRFHELKIGVSMFITPDPRQIKASASLGADSVEIHTGAYANLADADLRTPARRGETARLGESATAALEKIRAAVESARTLKLNANAGHGLNYRNIGPVAAIRGIQWFHIGHAIVARSIMVGMTRAVSEMVELLRNPTKLTMAKHPAKRR
ncbi:MAG: pyridoxine 5'-phosphate synthase [Candidatus Binataceae bacterium]